MEQAGGVCLRRHPAAFHTPPSRAVWREPLRRWLPTGDLVGGRQGGGGEGRGEGAGGQAGTLGGCTRWRRDAHPVVGGSGGLTAAPAADRGVWAGGDVEGSAADVEGHVWNARGKGGVDLVIVVARCKR